MTAIICAFLLECFVLRLSAATPVAIPDPGLQAAIRAALNKPSGDITTADMENLTTLDASLDARGFYAPVIQTLEGLQSARNLAVLDLRGYPDWDAGYPSVSPGILAGLAGLTNLHSLDLSWNWLSPVAFPPGLTGLQTLHLNGVGLWQASNWTFLDPLPGLQTLSVGNNWLASVPLPAGLTNLQSFAVWGNTITDASFVTNLLALRNLNASDCQLTNFSLPAGMTKLESLDLSWNNLAALTLPGDLHSLETLHLSVNQLMSLTVPAGLTNLQELSLQYNGLTNLAVEGTLRDLRTLQLSGNSVVTSAFLGNLSGLQTLIFDNNGLTNLVLPANLSNLQTLHLGYNGLTNLTVPGALTNLLRLELSGNRLTDFNFLSGCSILQELTMREGMARALHLPANLATLQLLDAAYNLLTNVVLPSSLAELRYLNLGYNQLPSLVLPGELGSLQTLNVWSNELTSLVLPETLGSLRWLELGANQLTNFGIPAGMHALETLRLWGNKLTTLAVPATQTNLIQLHLSQNQLTNLTFAGDLPRLRLLDLTANRLPDYTFLGVLSGLEVLSLQHNDLRSLVLPELLSLRFLDLGYNRITNLTFLGHPAGLATLYLHANELTTVTLPPGLTGLRQLHLSNNQLTTFDFVLLAELTSLERLGLNNNQITSLYVPPGLASLRALELWGNPLADLAAHASIDPTRLVISSASPIRIVGFWISPPRPLGSGQLGMQLRGAPGSPVQVQQSTNLVNWETSDTVVIGWGGWGDFEADGVASDRRFFRLLLPPPQLVNVGGYITRPNSDIGPNTIANLTNDTTFGWQMGDCAIPAVLNGFTLAFDSGNGNAMNYTGDISGPGGLRIYSTTYERSDFDYWNAPVRIGGAIGNTYTGPTLLLPGTVWMEKTSGDALRGTITVGSNADTSRLAWKRPNQISDLSDVTVRYCNIDTNSYPGRGTYLNLNGWTDTIQSLTLEAGTYVETGTGGVLTTASLIVGGQSYPSGNYTAGNASFVTGSGSIVVVAP